MSRRPTAMRKRTRRRIVVPLPPRGLRPRLAPSTVRDLGLAHWTNLDALASPGCSVDVMWQFLGGALTWLEVAGRLHHRQPDVYAEALAAMARQCDVGAAVVERFKRTGRVGLSGPEYQTAKTAAEYMDELAQLVDLPTAVAAAEASERKVNRMAGAAQQEQEA